MLITLRDDASAVVRVREVDPYRRVGDRGRQGVAVYPESTDTAVRDLTEFDMGLRSFRRGDFEQVARVGTELDDGQERFPLLAREG